MLRSALTVGFAISALLVPAPRAERASESPSKGYSAVILYGGPLEKPIRIGGIQEATNFYVALAVALRTGEEIPYPTVKNRPCIGIAVFRARPDGTDWPVDLLQPEQADLHYWFYPAHNGAPTVTQSSRVLGGELLEKLTHYQVPLQVKAGYTTPCEWGR